MSMDYRFVRRTLPVILTSIIALFMVVSYYLVSPIAGDASSIFRSVAVFIFSMAVPVGTIGYLYHNGTIVRKRQRGDWIYSLVGIVALLVTFFAGFTGETIGTSPLLSFIYGKIAVRIGYGIYSLFAFFVISSVFRALTTRNINVAVMTVVVVALLLGQSPIGAVAWGGFPVIATWIVNVLNIGGQRGLIIGVGIGSLGLGIRIIMGWERSAILGSREETGAGREG